MKKVLIITYYWPPAGGPGVQRVLKFAKYLPEFGWQPVILTVNRAEFPATDPTIIEDFSDSVPVHRTKLFDPTTIYKKIVKKSDNDSIPTFILNPSETDSPISTFFKWIRANFFVPDAKISWISNAFKAGLKIIKNEKIDIIFSSSPPHSVQLIAKKLAGKTGLRWVADFRDPWRDAFWQREMKRVKWMDKKDEKLELSVLSSADSLITVSPSLVDAFRQKTERNIFLIPNGFDEEDFQSIKRIPGEKFSITYLGTLGKDQKIDNFLHAVNGLEKDWQNKLNIEFYGSLHPSIKNSIENSNLSHLISVYPYVPHQKAVELMVNSELLLLVIPDVPNNSGIVTGKIYEYLASNNFILGIGPTNSDAAQILRITHCGQMFDYADNLIPVLKQRLKFWTEKQPLTIDTNQVNQYSRRNQTGMLANVFEGKMN